jgi:plasmid stabilization system protein ParE
MKSGYKIDWTNHALIELKETFDYLETNWTEKELNKLGLEIEKTLELISINPELFPKTRKKKNVRRVLVTKHNTLYYRTSNKKIEILSFFSNRKNPNKLEI